jgi:hypothetical protein
MNGFTYEEDEKRIRIKDGKTIVIWEYVEKMLPKKLQKCSEKVKVLTLF